MMQKPIDVIVRCECLAADALREYAERRLAFALRRFDQESRHVTVRFVDINGPRRGVDSRCAIALELVNGRRVDVSATTAWPFASVNRAAKRLTAVLRRERQRLQVARRQVRQWRGRRPPHHRRPRRGEQNDATDRV